VRLHLSFSEAWHLLRRTFNAWSEHEAPRLAAAVGFYTVLSLAPLVILVMAIVGLVYSSETAQGYLLSQVDRLIGQSGSDAVREMIKHAQKPAAGTFASILGIAVLLFGASGVFEELRAALNKMWDATPANETGIWGMIRERFLSIGMALAVGFLFLVSLLASAALSAAGKFFHDRLPAPPAVLAASEIIVSLVAITIVFALIFRYMPAVRIPWRDVWIGAAVAAILFTIGKALIGLYLGTASVGSAYGAAGSLVVVVVWVYYSAIIFLFGAEFTHVISSPVRQSRP